MMLHHSDKKKMQHKNKKWFTNLWIKRMWIWEMKEEEEREKKSFLKIHHT